MLIIAGSLLSLWCYTCLEVELRLAVLKFLSIVVLARLKLKVLLHHIDVVLVVLLADARVAPDEDTELVEGLGYELALLKHFSGVLLEEGTNVDHRYFS
jgi:hypothetical protein